MISVADMNRAGKDVSQDALRALTWMAVQVIGYGKTFSAFLL